MIITDLHNEVDALMNAANFHEHMPAAIKDASIGSAALEEVRTAQYNDALLGLQRAIAKVITVQHANEELAYAERPHEAVDKLLKDLDL